MRSQTLFLLFLGALAIAVLGGCAPKPDLVANLLPDLGTDPIAYCNLDQAGRLIITVTNQGTYAAPASVTKVTFTTLPTGNHVVNLDTPALGIGNSSELEPIDLAAFPSNCYQADCHFTITVDSTGVVEESEEEDNSVSGYCIG